ncbi:heavy metal translocatin [Durotheca rogersii]|uniref:heavy metal translocatin n=1 Tax=Durotheca rogersii TaxID=419775 RepID=UPI00221ED1CE|nr:heavy metal translocatin [Durotheca rogersii]KAI5865102.1 heavy metal translocatin [Durotheca rogersii]
MGEPKGKAGCTAGCCAPPRPVVEEAKKEDDCSSACCAGGAAAAAAVVPAAAAAVEAAEESGCRSDPVSGDEDSCCGDCGTADAASEPDDECCGLIAPKSAPSCQDACCSSKKNERDVRDDCCKPSGPAVVKSCQDSCCDAQEEDAFDAGCCGPFGDLPQDRCKDKCCDTQEEGASHEDCCGPSNNLPQDTCKDECCDDSEPDTAEPPCCQQKQKPCCDDSCIDRLMLRETANKTKKDDDAASSSQRSVSSKENWTREKYKTRLAALGCLCRALIALGQESCCASREVSSVERKRGLKKACSSGSRKKQASACKSVTTGTCCSASPKRSSSTLRDEPVKSCAKGCCNKTPKNPSVTPAQAASSCCDTSFKNRSRKDGNRAVQRLPGKDRGTDANITNVEMGMSGAEHVVLSITGMTCTGCETKLQQTLGRVSAVNHLKTSLVMARVEFQLDLSLATPEDIMKHIERTTEFKCDRIATHGSTLDVIPVEGAKQFIQQDMPLGVESVDLVDKQTVRILFEPDVIGARDLLYKGFQTPPNLAPLQADPSVAAGSKHVRYMGWMTLASALLTIPVLVLAWAPLEPRPLVYGSVSLALATIVQVFIAGPFYPKALKSLVFSRVVEMDLLIVLSTTAAYIFSVVSFAYSASGRPLPTGDFFETSTLLVTLIMVGRWVSALARQKAVESISLRSLQTPTATLVSHDGTETDIDARLLQYGDIFKVAPHTQAPTDGVVLSGTTEVDESMLTGESLPIEKKPGSVIIAGSLNGSGTITARLTKLPGENTISIIAGMVDDAKLSKPKIQELADRVASYFVPTVILLTIIVFVAWVGVGIRVQGKSGSEAVTQAVTYGITVLIVSCPCAIGLAVPMVIMIASGVAAEKGLIFKESEAIEVAYKTSHVVFDKTGTLTEGRLSVTMEEYPTGSRQEVAPQILGLLAGIKHPVSSTIASHLESGGISGNKVGEIKSLPGKGVQGIIDGVTVRGGNSRWLGTESNPIVQDVLSKGYTAFCVVIGSELRAVFGLADTIRQDAASVVAELQRRNIAVSMLSGDDDGAVQAAATSLGIPRGCAISRCSPADKQAYIQTLLAPQTGEGRGKSPVVVFVGDGTNDAVALAQATIGVHVNSGTDVAKSAADVVLVRPSLGGVLAMVDVSRAAVRRVAFNFGWSFVYNVFAVLLAAGAFVKAAGGDGDEVRIPPEFAGLGELVSVLPVIVVAVSLRWARL